MCFKEMLLKSPQKAVVQVQQPLDKYAQSEENNDLKQQKAENEGNILEGTHS